MKAGVVFPVQQVQLSQSLLCSVFDSNDQSGLGVPSIPLNLHSISLEPGRPCVALPRLARQAVHYKKKVDTMDFKRQASFLVG